MTSVLERADLVVKRRLEEIEFPDSLSERLGRIEQQNELIIKLLSSMVGSDDDDIEEDPEITGE